MTTIKGFHWSLLGKRHDADTIPLDKTDRTGVKVLHDCKDATVDICFVHGLTGDRESTWTADGQSAPWPQALLPTKLDRVRIITYGYNAYIVGRSVASGNGLLDHAGNLLNDLTIHRDEYGAASRPLIFVAHSLGGLVCKTAILRSRNNADSHLRDIFDSLKGVIFLGTPHKGAWMASWAKIPASGLGLVKSTNKKLLEVLETSNQYLQSIQADFLGLVRQQREAGRPIGITCFFEELPLQVVGKIVSKESAVFEGYNLMSIYANHRNMVRFSSEEDNGFKRLVGELRRWVRETISMLPRPKPAPQIPKAGLACLQSLAFPDMETRFYDIGEANDGTCGWLSRHDMFNSWVTSDRGLLWIKGKPGAGKSTLLKYILEKQEILCGVDDNDLVLTFFFHDRGHQLQKTPLGFFRSLLYQVLRREPNALQDLLNTFDRRFEEVGKPGGTWQWHQNELQQTFLSSLPRVLERYSVWLFIDALDECGDYEAPKLVKLLQSLLKSLGPSSNGMKTFHVCFTCRHYPVMSSDCASEICLEEENQQDIATYVRDKLAGVGSSIAPTILNTVIASAKGVFLWAYLVVDRVLRLERDGESLDEIEAVVRSIPPELNDIYQELFQDMGMNSLRLFQWVYFAIRPLNLAELRWALAVGADCPHNSLHAILGKLAGKDENGMKRHIWKLSHGLAGVTTSGAVHFIHQSVKDFFYEKIFPDLSHRLESTDVNTTSGAVRMAHFQLSRTCIRYLMMNEIAQTKDYKDDSQFPFLDYASEHWVEHAKQSDDPEDRHDNLLELFSWPSNHILEIWVLIYRDRDTRSIGQIPKGTYLIYISSRYQIIQPLMRILEEAEEKRDEVNKRDKEGMTPLMWAAEEGQEKAARLLLETGKADANIQDEYGLTPLHLTTQSCNNSLTRLLLKTGKADVNIQNKYGNTPLYWATEWGYGDISKLLLKFRGKMSVY